MGTDDGVLCTLYDNGWCRMNPMTFVAAMTTIWMLIPEERREQYVNDLLDLVEDLAADVRDSLRKRKDDETEEVNNEEQ